jgi:hypothetical protein
MGTAQGAHEKFRDPALAGYGAVVPCSPFCVSQQQAHSVTPICIGAPVSMLLIGADRMEKRFTRAARVDDGGNGGMARDFGGIHPMEALS